MYRQSEKNLLNSNISSTCPQYGELRPTNGLERLAGLGHPSKFPRVSHVGFITAAMSLTRGQPNFKQCLAVSWAGALYIHFPGLLPRRNFARCKIHFTSKSCILLYWRHYGTALQQRASAKLCGVWYTEWNYGTFADCATYICLGGHHIGRQLTF